MTPYTLIDANQGPQSPCRLPSGIPDGHSGRYLTLTRSWIARTGSLETRKAATLLNEPGDSGALLLHRVLELPLALFLQQIVESFGFRVRFLLQNGLVGL